MMDNVRMELRLPPVDTAASVDLMLAKVKVVLFNPPAVLMYLLLNTLLHDGISCVPSELCLCICKVAI